MAKSSTNEREFAADVATESNASSSSDGTDSLGHVS